MKARRVKGIDPDGDFAGNVARIVRVRSAELHSFAPKALDPAEVDALHDMRIAAKRLRYILELSSPVFGPYAATAAKRAKDLQDLIGEIHDCDVTLPRIEAVMEQLRAADAQAVRRAAEGSEDLDPALVGRAAHGDAWRGLQSMAIYLQARRELLFARFLELWTQLGRDGFRARLEFAIGERPASQDANRPITAQAVASGEQP